MKSWKHVLGFRERQIKTFSIPEVDESFGLLRNLVSLETIRLKMFFNTITIQFNIDSINYITHNIQTFVNICKLFLNMERGKIYTKLNCV